MYAYVGGDPVNRIDPWGLGRTFWKNVTSWYTFSADRIHREVNFGARPMICDPTLI
jgi:hypothetical protein